MKSVLRLITMLCFILPAHLFAQVAITSDGTAPASSAMLDIKNPSPARGLLIPRMTTALRTGVGSPADGLSVYDTDTKSFWFYKSGTGWTEISSFDLPYAATTASASGTALFNITNSSTGGAALFTTNNASNNSAAVDIVANGALPNRGLRVNQIGLGLALELTQSNTANINSCLAINHLGNGNPALIQSTNALNTKNIIEGYTAGSGIVVHAQNANASGNGSAGMFEKSTSYSGAYINGVATELEVRHPVLLSNGLSGLRIFNIASNASWTVYTNSSGPLSFFYKNNQLGLIDNTTGAYTATSDYRVKSNITPMPDLLLKVMQLQPKSYSYIFDETHKNVLGFIAQEVEPLFPQVVYKSDVDTKDGLYRMDYAAFGVIAVKAVQEQQKIIESQQKQIDDLKKQVEEIKAALKNK